MRLLDSIDPVEEGVKELWVVFQPGSMERKVERCSVLIKMSIEVVDQKVVELVAVQDVGASINHRASRHNFIGCWIFPSVQLVHHHLPNSARSRRTVLEIAVAPVWHLEEHGVRPEGHVLQRGGDGGVVEEGLLLHHRELLVASNSQEGRSQADDRVVGDVCKLVDDQPDS